MQLRKHVLHVYSWCHRGCHAPGRLGFLYVGAGRFGLALVENTQGGIGGDAFRGILHAFADILNPFPHLDGGEAGDQAAHERAQGHDREGGPPGAKTPIHTHPGSEAFYVLAGEQTQRTPHGVTRLEVGQSMPGHGPDTVMEVPSSGTTDLDQFVMFLVDATKPFTSPAEFPSAQR
jgi:hypothetical protein